MGKVLSMLQRKVNRFNVENRAHKVISKEKPIPAPMYPSTKQELERIVKEHPEILQQHLSKDNKLQDRLKQVYVQSHDPVVPESIHSSEETRPLPHNRRIFEGPEFGFQDPEMIPQGRFSLRQAMKFITDHQGDPKIWTTTAIAKEYHLDKNILEKILRYYRTFEVYIPEIQARKNQQIIAEPSKVKEKLEGGKPDQN